MSPTVKFKSMRVLSTRSQSGAALILIMFMMGMGVVAFMLKSVNSGSFEFRQQDKTTLALESAKNALISWAVSYPTLPGMFPYPDRGTDGNYNGESDCFASNVSFNRQFLIGQLPTRDSVDTNCIQAARKGLGAEFKDAQGNNLWYAVSRNLVRNYQNPAVDPIINPGLINYSLSLSKPYTGDPLTSSPYPWLVVKDRNGVTISDRVAAVIIAPGHPLPNQDRSTIAPAISNYLDSLQIGGSPYSDQDYDTDNEDFIIAPDSSRHPTTDATYQAPYYFNDRLVYITIDELVAALEARAGNEARQALVRYKNANAFYPYASQLGTAQNFTPEEGLDKGFLPVNHQSCNYSKATAGSIDIYSMACDKPIFDENESDISGVVFTSSGVLLDSGTGSCIANGTQCSCSGNGVCTRSSLPVILISCADNACSVVTFGGNNLIGSVRASGGKFTSATGACTQQSGRPSKDVNSCTQSDSNITCAGNIAGTFASSSDPPFDAYLASWFTTNQWQNYFYYHMNRPTNTTFQSGQRTTGIEGVLVSAGRPIAAAPFAVSKVGSAQIRPSCNDPANYLDSIEGADGDRIYDGSASMRTQNYNDLTFTLPR
jgi:hypothetical protein